MFHGPVLEDRVAASADALLLGEAESWAGEWLVSPGDATGDGLADVWVGAPHSPEVAEDAGEVYLVAELGVSQDIRSASVFTAQGEARSDYFGNGEATVADLDQDGFTDLLVSAQLNDQVADTSGKGYLFYGPFAGTYGAESADAWMLGRGEGAILASCFAPGDLDGDGNIDLSCAEGDVEGDPYSRINLYYGYSF